MSDTLHWFKSSHSDSGGGSCVEVAFSNTVAPRPHTIHLRDSKIPHGPTVAITPDAWSAFVAWQG
ncbi:DUF397 domain-containing protein [Streptomyces sp. HUAS MG47]|uniref:DUF397 domain-containing protein n=1 Tax=Streptomyces solicamelliae TaxID=3231716 RepID=UPI003877F95E